MKKHFISAMLSALLFLTGCSAESSPEPVQGTFFAMDTVMDFTIYGESGLIDQSESLIASLESLVSVTDANSELYAINQTGSGTLTGKASSLMEQALEICRRTDGALDLSIYPIVRAWGFTTGSYQVPDEAEIQALLPLVDYRKIQYDAATGTVTLPEGMEIDLGSVAKGYAGQLAAQMLREHGVQSALLNLGGNVQTVGAKPDGSPWQIGIKDPQGEDAMMVLSVEDQAVVTSGGYERYFEQDGQTYWHIMDPSTGHPADSGLISVTIVGDEGVVCDGLSTALFVMGLEKAADLWAQSGDFEAVFVTASGEVYITEGLRDRFALTEQYADTPVSVIER
ncbi:MULTISPECIES: FAD:protein FMN transferase [Dysosmobacter]|uniref:FAD:protein FMN transferase n=1 Tax=Dysosmobacter segnis TaxID=2763042 RepID=A0A923MLN1_9FIRM|nr:FAD:protein FMN transferase [Dysosmobacter segnis]MBC5772001.1 FAD:protein FMN transferase [Dysosmobacter segnis]